MATILEKFAQRNKNTVSGERFVSEAEHYNNPIIKAARDHAKNHSSKKTDNLSTALNHAKNHAPKL